MRKFLKNSIWLILEKLSFIISSLVIGVIVARFLGPSNYGIISTSFAIIGLMTPICALGLQPILVQAYASKLFSIKAHKASAIYIQLKFVAALVFIAILAGVFFLMQSPPPALLITLVIFSPILLQGGDIIQGISQAEANSKILLKLRVIQLFLSALIKLFLVWKQASLFAFAFAYAADLAILYTLYGVYLLCTEHTKYIPSRSELFTVDKQQTLHFLKLSWPIAVSTLTINAYMKMDILMISYLLDNHATGIYAAATRIAEGIYFIPLAVVTAIFPFLKRIHDKEKVLYDRYSQLLSSFFIYGALVFTVVIIFTSQALITALYGSDFLAAAEVLSILILACPPVFIGILLRRGIIIEGFQKISMYVTILSLLLNFIMNFTLIPMIGPEGAAWATVISRLGGSVLFYGIFKETRNSMLTMLTGFSPIQTIRNLQVITTNTHARKS